MFAILLLFAADKALLELALPEGVPPPDYAPERVSALRIDGKDYSRPRLARRSIAVTLPAKGDTVKVEYEFWPSIYMRVTRTRAVRLSRDETTKLDLTKEDRSDKLWVIYVPTPVKVVREMCKLAAIKKGDTVYDIGCGDGRLVIMAVKEFGAKRGVGIDLLPERIAASKANAKRAGVEDKVTFIQKDALTIKDFGEADVVLLYLSEELNARLKPVLRKTLKPGARIVSHRFPMSGWVPEKTLDLEEKDVHGEKALFLLHRWTIKAKD